MPSVPDCPVARVANLVISEPGNELLVCDLDSQELHCLRPVAAAIWRASNGQRTIAEVRRAAEKSLGEPVSARAMDEAISLLSRSRLLQEPVPPTVSRRWLVRSAVAAGSVPVVLTTLAPAASASSSPASGYWDGFWQWDGDEWVWVWIAIQGPNGEPAPPGPPANPPTDPPDGPPV